MRQHSTFNIQSIQQQGTYVIDSEIKIALLGYWLHRGRKIFPSVYKKEKNFLFISKFWFSIGYVNDKSKTSKGEGKSFELCLPPEDFVIIF